MSGGRRNGTNPVKVVIINTQYVQTDAGSFKSVVQNLTGKDSAPPAPSPRFQPPAAAAAAPDFSRGLSFKDLERMLKELPPLDELCRLYPE